MRKKLLALALVFALVFALCACGAAAQTAKEEASQVVEATATPAPTPEPTQQPEPVIDYEITYTNCKVGTDDADSKRALDAVRRDLLACPVPLGNDANGTHHHSRQRRKQQRQNKNDLIPHLLHHPSRI